MFLLQLAFRSVQQMLQELRGKLRHLLKLPVPNVPMATTDDSVSMEMEQHISSYMCNASQRFETSQCVQVQYKKMYLCWKTNLKVHLK